MAWMSCPLSRFSRLQYDMLLLITVLAGCNIDQQISNDKGDGGDTGTPYDPTKADTDMDGWVDAADCEPDDQDIHPDAFEACNGIDDDCDGDADEGFDEDDDGYLDIRACYAMDGEYDCDDADAAVNPDAEEICDGQDNDCDGGTDDIDEDADSYTFCTDCDDHDAFVSPDAPDACDGIDNNCNGQVDEIWDADGDGYSPCQGDCDDEAESVNPAAGDRCDGVDNDCNLVIDDAFDLDHDGVTTCAGDCDDTDPTVYLGAPEQCDGLDTDCDPSTGEIEDQDGDGYTICTGDCDDGSALASPVGTEACDGLDNDCTGYTDDLPECWGCISSGAWYVCDDTADWPTAELVCEGFGGTLVVVDDATENADLLSLSSSPTWIGATDQVTEGTWLEPATDGPIPYDRWDTSEPNDEDNDCALLNAGGRRGYWADASCTSAYRFTCEI